MSEIAKLIMKLSQRMTALETQMKLIFWGISVVGGMITVYISTKLTIHIKNGKKIK